MPGVEALLSTKLHAQRINDEIRTTNDELMSKLE